MTNKGRNVMKINRSKETGGLWEMDMNNHLRKSEHKINAIIKLPGVADRFFFTYPACSPVISMLCRAIDNNNLTYFPENVTSNPHPALVCHVLRRKQKPALSAIIPVFLLKDL